MGWTNRATETNGTEALQTGRYVRMRAPLSASYRTAEESGTLGRAQKIVARYSSRNRRPVPPVGNAIAPNNG